MRSFRVAHQQPNYTLRALPGRIGEPTLGIRLVLTGPGTMCNGERLNALRLDEVDGIIYIRDKRVRPYNIDNDQEPSHQQTTRV